jgi:hypothetical protein
MSTFRKMSDTSDAGQDVGSVETVPTASFVPRKETSGRRKKTEKARQRSLDAPE